MKSRYFLILAFLFFAPVVRAQVVVPDSVASWYLEQNQKRIVLEKEVATLKNEISSLSAQISNDTKIIDTYKNDGEQYKGKLQLKMEELKHKQGELNKLEREMRKYILQKWLAYGVAILVIILSLVI